MLTPLIATENNNGLQQKCRSPFFFFLTYS